jgi:hypothetical protein
MAEQQPLELRSQLRGCPSVFHAAEIAMTDGATTIDYVIDNDAMGLLQTATKYRPHLPPPVTISKRCFCNPIRKIARLRRIVHNHPGGDPTPSRADVDMTKQIVEVARGLGIEVHDHIIVGKQGHASLKGLKLM